MNSMDAHLIPMTTIVIAMFSGILLSLTARYFKMSAIAPLLLGGIVLGREGVGFVNSASLGDGLHILISLCVAIILFEGGLSLEPTGFKKAQGVILKLLTLGVLVTWLGTAVAVFLLFKFTPKGALLAGSLVIVTGPTVITPILQRIQVKERLHHILHWEGVLIDPIGVFIAILCYELFSIQQPFLPLLGQLGMRFGVGLAIGSIGGLFIFILLNRRFVAEEQVNIAVLTSVLFLFGVSEMILDEAGILTVVTAGIILGWKKPAHLKNLLRFKSELTELSIATLFILLAANLDLSSFRELGVKAVLLIVIVLFVIRPLNVVVSSWGSNLKLRERLFLSWINPRGIIAGSMASLFALQLADVHPQEAAFFEAFTFGVIGVTVMLQGFFSNPIARLLQVKAPAKKGWLIVGAHPFARKIAAFITQTTHSLCLLVDTNQAAVAESRREGYFAIHQNAMDIDNLPQEETGLIGNLLALTDNRDLNELICSRWADRICPEHLYRWSPTRRPGEQDPLSIGREVWRELPKPSLIAEQIKNRQMVVMRSHLQTARTKIIPGTWPLMASRDDMIHLHSLPWEGEGEALLLQNLSLHLPFFISPEHILRLKVGSFEELINEVLRFADKVVPEFPSASTFSMLMTQQRDFPTTLGNGVAIPHAYCSKIKEPLCFLVRLPDGLDLKAYDGLASKLFFILLSPPGDPETHLRLLADIAQIAHDPQKVVTLLESKTAEEVMTFLREVRLE
ncbi:MAG: hypothetical protein EHM72_15550 [Calditrichaeota bacterium]|nr:MAG: hypothetical protein EHM72_15550 [Calditrichota bacterium]